MGTPEVVEQEINRQIQSTSNDKGSKAGEANNIGVHTKNKYEILSEVEESNEYEADTTRASIQVLNVNEGENEEQRKHDAMVKKNEKSNMTPKTKEKIEETEGSKEEAHSQDSYDSTKTHYGSPRGDSLKFDGVIIEKAEEIVKNEDIPPDKPPYYVDKVAIEVEGDMMIADQTDARFLSQAETEPCVKIHADDNNNGKSVSTEKMSPNANLRDIVSHKVT
ncbi:hypothetical protein RND71_032012 [Anisodus tanguticus]|uniref:Uncharacterized protein n=1 Tax=Anisodus tanguticus TaxID=243964 RepID=A0AAE1RED0_9SOLA|nr:hypothetical protein RND71_032012 [Anisodus tanguticus]